MLNALHRYFWLCVYTHLLLLLDRFDKYFILNVILNNPHTGYSYLHGFKRYGYISNISIAKGFRAMLKPNKITNKFIKGFM